MFVRATYTENLSLSDKKTPDVRKRILKIQASLTAHWHDKGADWRGLAHTPAHEVGEDLRESPAGN